MSAATRTAGSSTAGNPLIASDRVEGTDVYARNGERIGSVKRLMIEKVSGRIPYAVVSFGSFMGLGGQEFTIPWGTLDYDTGLAGYRTDVTEERLRGAPDFPRDDRNAWVDRDREREFHDYWSVPYYW
jgi:hypothetical protein